MDILKNVRHMTVNPQSKAISISVAKLLKKIGITPEILPIKNIPVTGYKDLISEGEYNVIDLRDFVK